MNDRVSRLYCPRKGCALVSMNGSFQRGRRYRCIECGGKLSEKPGKGK